MHPNRPQSHIAEQTQQGLRITWIGLVINVLLTILKFIVGFIGHSRAAVADAAHSFSDLITDIATQLQRKLIVEGPSVTDVVVHIEPDHT